MPNVLEVVITARDEASGVLKGVGGVLSGALKVGLGVAAAGFGALATGIGLSISEAVDAQAVQAQLDAVLRSTGGAAGVTAEMANNLATSLSGVTRFSDDAILSGENLLLTFTNIGKDIFPDVTEVMLDMSTAMGQDLKASAIQLGKALNDPAQGMTALTRVGVTFTDEQKKMVEEMVAAGDVAGAQALILAELQREFGGSAEAAGQTFAGQLDILKNSLLNVAEGVGTALLPILQQFVSGVLLPAVPTIQAVANAFTSFIGVLAEGDVGGAFDALGEGLAGIVSPEVVEFIYSLGPAVEDAVTWIRDVLIPTLVEWGTQIWSQLGPGLAQLGVWIQDIAAVVLPLLQQAIAFVIDHFNIFGPILAVIAGLILALNAPIAAVIAAVVLLATAWANNWGGIQDKTTAVINFIQPFIETAITAIREFIGTALAAITGFWQAHGEAIMSAARQAWENIQVVIDTVLKVVGSLFAAFKAAFEGDWKGFGENLRAAWDAAWEGIKRIASMAWENIKTGISMLITAVIDFFKNTDWKAVGDNVVQSIANGIRAGVKWAVDAITALAKAMWDSLVGFFKGGSPFQLMIEAGENFAQSMAMGIDRASAIPVAAAVEMSRETSNVYNFTPTIYTNSPTESLLSDIETAKSWWRS